MKNAEEEEAEKEHQEHAKVEGNFTSLEYKTTVKGVFKSILVPGLSNTETDIAMLIVSNERQCFNLEPAKENAFYKDNEGILFKMGKSCEVVKLAITLETEDVEGVEDLESTEDVYTKTDMPFNSLMTEYWIADAVYVCTYQGASGKSSKTWEWFYTKSNHVVVYQLS